MTLAQWIPWIWLAIIFAGLLLGGYLLMKLFRFEMRARMKTLPSKQWEVGREFRRRVKYRFDKEGIRLLPTAS